MEEKRVSTITIIIIVVVIAIIAIVVLGIMGVFSNIIGGNENENNVNIDQIAGNLTDEELDKIPEGVSNIEGENNIEIDANQKKINNSNVINNSYYLDEFKFSNFYISSIEGKTKITCTITNISDTYATLDAFYIYFYDDNSVCAGAQMVKSTRFGAKESQDIDIIVDADVANLSEIDLKRVYSTKK